MTTPSLGEVFHDPNGCHWGGRPHLGPCRDRSHDAGRALTEVRTVLSRAQTAQRLLLDRSAGGPYEPLERPRLPKPAPTIPGAVDAGEPPYDPDPAYDPDPGAKPFDDPDHAVMVAVLDQVITALAPWQRGTGKTRRWVTDDGPARLVVTGQPDWYSDEAGDEMFAGQQAVLALLRARLAGHFMYDAATARTVLGVIDGFTRELVDEEREEEEEEGEEEWEPCGAFYTDPDRPDRPAQDPCGKRVRHWLGPDTDWKRDFHSNGLLKWPVTDQERA